MESRARRDVKKTVVYVQSHTKTQYHFPQKHTSVLDICNLTCVWPKAGVTEGRISRCFLLSCSPRRDLPGHPTLCLSLLRMKKEGQKLTNLLAARFHCCLYWAGITKKWVSVVKKHKTAAFEMAKFHFYGFEGKSLTSMTPLTVFLSIGSLHFGGSWQGKSSCLD